MMRRRKWQNLPKSTIDCRRLKAIISDLELYNINNLAFGVDVFRLHETKGSKYKTSCNRGAVDVKFNSIDYGDDDHMVEMIMKIFFNNCGKDYCVHIEMWATAVYGYKPYDTKLQDYLYSHACGLIENCNALTSLRKLHLPDKLDLYQTTSTDWVSQRTDVFSWVDMADFSEVRRLRDYVKPFILMPKKDNVGICDRARFISNYLAKERGV